MYSTERAYAVAVVSKLLGEGFTIKATWDGEEYTKAPLTPRQAVDAVEAVEHGIVILDHQELGRVKLSLLFQGGEPLEVICDYSAKDDATLDLVAQYIEEVEAGVPNGK